MAGVMKALFEILVIAVVIFGVLLAYDHFIGTPVLKEDAQAGDVEAQYALGEKYFHGILSSGLGQDYSQAHKWFQKAAANDNALAQFYLGLIYYEGWGAPQNFHKAYHWNLKAANQGIHEAQHNLALQYANGRGVQENNSEAYFWLTLASAQMTDSAELRDRVLSLLELQEVEEAQQRAMSWSPSSR